MQDLQELEDLSNSVQDLIDENRLDDAEKNGFRLLERYPDQSDGLFRLADVYKAKKEYQKAADYYILAADFTTKLKEEKQDVLDMITEVEKDKTRVFMKTYDSLNNRFKEIFSDRKSTRLNSSH